MTDEIITKEILKTYTLDFKYYAQLCKRVKFFQSRYKYPSVNERRRLENLIKETQQLKRAILADQKILKEYIARIPKPEFRAILTMRYIYLFKFQQIEKELFSENPDYLDNPDKYRDKTMRWHREALQALQMTNKEECTAVHTLKKIIKTCRHELKRSRDEVVKNFIEKILTIERNKNIKSKTRNKG